MHALVLVHSPKMSCRSKDHSVETCHGCKPMRIENNKQHEKSLYFMLLIMSPSFSSFVRFFFVSVAKFSLKKYDSRFCILKSHELHISLMKVIFLINVWKTPRCSWSQNLKCSFRLPFVFALLVKRSTKISSTLISVY